MEAVISDITEVEKEIAVQISAEELVPHFEKAYRRIQPTIEIKGFRKGKAPLDLIKKMYGEQIEVDSLDVVATDIYRELAKKKNIQPVAEPVLVDMDYKRGELFSFKVKYEVLPRIELKDYKGIAVEKLIHDVTDQEVEDEIRRICRANATLVEAQSAEDDEHVITADVQELDDTGFPVIGKRTENERFYLGGENLAPEAKSALTSVPVGQAVRIKYQSQHGDHTHPIHFQATVKKIEKIQLPELTDEFVKRITKGKTSTVAEFREKLRKDVEEYWRDRSERRLVDMLASEIVRRHDFPIPETFVGGIIDRQLEDLKGRFADKTLPPDFDESRYREDLRPSAIFQARWFLLREQIIEKEGFKVDKGELESLAEERAKRTGIDKARLVDFFKKSEEAQRQVLSDKLIEFLKSHAEITEKVTEEFF